MGSLSNQELNFAILEQNSSWSGRLRRQARPCWPLLISAGGSRPENFQGFRSVYKGFPLPGEQVRTEMNRFEPFWNLSNGSQFLTNSKPGEQNPGFQTRRTESELFKPSEQNPDFQTGRTESWFSKPGEQNLKFPNRANKILNFQTRRTESYVSKPGEQNLEFPNRANRISAFQTERTESELYKPGEQKLNVPNQANKNCFKPEVSYQSTIMWK